MKTTLHSLGLLLLRVCISGLMLAHAGQEWMTFYGTDDFPDPLGLGSQLTLIVSVVSEVILSLFLIVGFATRLAAFGLASMMAVAFVLVYGGAPWQKKELVAAFLCVYVALTVAGGGSLSLERVVFKE